MIFNRNRSLSQKDPLPEGCSDHSDCGDNICNPKIYEITDKEISAYIRKAFDCFTLAELRKDTYLSVMVFRLISVYFSHCRMPKHDVKVRSIKSYIYITPFIISFNMISFIIWKLESYVQGTVSKHQRALLRKDYNYENVLYVTILLELVFLGSSSTG